MGQWLHLIGVVAVAHEVVGAAQSGSGAAQAPVCPARTQPDQLQPTARRANGLKVSDCLARARQRQRTDAELLLFEHQCGDGLATVTGAQKCGRLGHRRGADLGFHHRRRVGNADPGEGFGAEKPQRQAQPLRQTGQRGFILLEVHAGDPGEDQRVDTSLLQRLDHGRGHSLGVGATLAAQPEHKVAAAVAQMGLATLAFCTQRQGRSRVFTGGAIAAQRPVTLHPYAIRRLAPGKPPLERRGVFRVGQGVAGRRVFDRRTEGCIRGGADQGETSPRLRQILRKPVSAVVPAQQRDEIPRLGRHDHRRLAVLIVELIGQQPDQNPRRAEAHGGASFREGRTQGLGEPGSGQHLAAAKSIAQTGQRRSVAVQR